jgi:hypothetical protein
MLFGFGMGSGVLGAPAAFSGKNAFGEIPPSQTIDIRIYSGIWYHAGFCFNGVIS